MTRFMIYPYMTGSEGAKALADALGGKCIRRTGSTYTRQEGDVIIGWGAGDCPFPQALNANPMIAINKLDFYERLAGHCIVPPFSVNKNDARRSLRFPVLCRTRIEGADGQGIQIAETPDDLVDARLYVELVNKTEEYRVHMGRMPDGEIVPIAVQKKLHADTPGIDPRIWTGDSTRLTYDHHGAPSQVLDVTKAAMSLCGELTFGGFDVIFDGTTAYVVEVNSAPMMTERTAALYACFFRSYVSALRPEEPEPEPEYEPTAQEIGDVFNDLSHERVGLRAIITGYLRDQRRRGG